MRAIIQVSLENDSLATNDEAAHAELMHILTIAARKLQRLREEARFLHAWERSERGVLADSNGNCVGKVELVLENK